MITSSSPYTIPTETEAAMMTNSESQKVVPSRSSAGGSARRPSSNTAVAKDFQDVYLQSCALKGVHPSRMVTLFLEDNILDINAEKLDTSDWRTVIEALKIARHNLRFIAIRSSQKNALPIRPQTKDVAPCRLIFGSILCHVATALGCTLATTNHLTCLELQNIPLTLHDLNSLNNGLSRNKTLQHLSLQQCPIGDAGVEVICKVMKNCFNVTSLNLSQCQLSWKSAETLALLVKHQTLYRHCDTWKETLRNEIAILDHMDGIQRITLNGNPKFGDRGAQILAEVLHDDLWLKALDMQECGVQDQGATALLSALKHNTTLFILDLRLNFVKDCNLRLRISQQLSFNVQGQTSQFKWFKLPVDAERSNKMRGRCRQSFRKRGIPWRVAARLGSIRHYPIGHVPGIANVFLHSKPTLLSGLSSEDRTEAGSIRSSLADNGRAPRLPLKISNQRCRSSLPNSGHSREILDVIRTEITDVRELLRKEKEARFEAEKRATKVHLEDNQFHYLK